MGSGVTGSPAPEEPDFLVLPLLAGGRAAKASVQLSRGPCVVSPSGGCK